MNDQIGNNAHASNWQREQAMRFELGCFLEKAPANPRVGFTVNYLHRFCRHAAVPLALVLAMAEPVAHVSDRLDGRRAERIR